MDEIQLINVKEGILSDNTALAEKIKSNLRKNGTFMLNLMSSPGSGKTSLILQTIDSLKKDFRIGIIEADIESKVDSEKVTSRGIKAVQLRTGGFCHLDATMVSEGLEALGIGNFDLLIIENIGNLVCPAEFDTGAIKNAMILSVPEGDDKPLKYPLMFSVVDVLLVNKIDTLSVFDFNYAAMEQRVKMLNSDITIFQVSAKTGEGIDKWVAWLKKEISDFKKSGSSI